MFGALVALLVADAQLHFVDRNEIITSKIFRAWDSSSSNEFRFLDGHWLVVAKKTSRV
jgi:hypothetical protein